MPDFGGMSPSERRREQRRIWLTFGLLCLGAIGGVLTIGEIAGQFVAARSSPEPAPAEAEVTEERTLPPPGGRHAGTVIQTAGQDLQSVLTAERSAEIAGAVLFSRGAIDLAHRVIEVEEAADRLLVASLVPVAPGQKAPHFRLVLYERSGDTWSRLSTLHDVEVHKRQSKLSNKGAVTIRDAGEEVLAIELPDSGPCLPITESDLANRRTLYVLPTGEEPTLLLNHISAGARGYDLQDQASVTLNWEKRTGLEGSGSIVVSHVVGTDKERWEVDFQHNEGSFTLSRLPDSILAEEERLASAAASEGLPEAQRQLDRLEAAIELIVPIEGPPEFCIEMPHRLTSRDDLDRQSWQDAVADRLFRVHLSRADLYSAQGEGRKAVELLDLEDPALVLSASAAGRRVLSRIRGPRIMTGARLYPGIELRPRKTWAKNDRFRARYPMWWLANGQLLIPEADEMEWVSDDWLQSLAASTVTGAIPPGLTPRELPSTVSALIGGATVSIIPYQLAASAAAGSAKQVAQTARESIAIIAELDQRYTGPQFRALDVESRTFAPATWEALQVYAPLQWPVDLTPSGSKLLVDVGVTCGGGFIQFCIGRADADSGTASGFADSCVAGNAPTIIPADITAVDGVISTPVDLPIATRPCYPRELRAPMDMGIQVLGWQTDNRLLLYHEARYLAVDVQLVGQPDASELRSLESGTSAAWRWPRSGEGDRYSVIVDDAGVWARDHQTDRDRLIDFWSNLPFGPATGGWQGSISPDGTWIAVWLESEGLWVAPLARL